MTDEGTRGRRKTATMGRLGEETHDKGKNDPQVYSPVEGGVKISVASLEGRDEEGDDKDEKAQEPRTTEREEEERSSDPHDKQGYGGRSSD